MANDASQLLWSSTDKLLKKVLKLIKLETVNNEKHI